jgi:ankyrin repeat protein
LPKKDGNTPLIIASRYDRSDVVDKLLDNGANIEATNKVTYLISFKNLSRTLFDIDVDHYFDVIDLS